MVKKKVISEKKSKVKEVKQETEPKKKIGSKEIYHKTGGRKRAGARVSLFLKKGDLIVNDIKIEDYFPGLVAKKVYEEPLRVVNRLDQMSGTIKVAGGGKQGQLYAVAHGISRALLEYDETFRPVLSRKKLLTRDRRVKERRKYGHAGKARKMKQSPKR